MIYLFGLALSALWAGGAMLVLGGAALFLRANGLLSMDLRLAISLAAAPTAAGMLFLLFRSNGFELPKEDLQRGYLWFSVGGGVAGMTLVWLGLMLLSIVVRPSEPAWGMARWLTPLFVVSCLGACLACAVLPSWLVAAKKHSEAEYQRALHDGDISALRKALAGQFRDDMKFAIERQDVAMLELFMDPPGNPPNRMWLCMPDVFRTRNPKLLESYLRLVDDRQRALNYGLRWAIIDGDAEVFEQAITLGADPCFEDAPSYLMFAADYDRVALARRLIQLGADVNLVLPRYGTALTRAVDKRYLAMTRVLLEAGARVNFETRMDESALQIACRRNSLPLVQLLLEQGADPNHVGAGNRTCLHTAYAHSADDEILQCLLSAGARADARDSQNRTPLELSLKEKDE